MSTSLSLSLQSLHPSYTYRCRIAAYTVGLGPYSPPIDIVTDEEGNENSTQANFSVIL